MSMSYPYLYTPVTLDGNDGRPHFVVDGGLLSNFPVWLFDSGSERPKVLSAGGREGGADQHQGPSPFGGSGGQSVVTESSWCPY